MTTILASASAPAAPYAVTHLNTWRNTGTQNRGLVARVRGIGKTTERWANIGPGMTTEFWPDVAELEPWLYLPGGIGIEGAVTADGTLGGIDRLYAVISTVQPAVEPSPAPVASGSSNYRYPLNTVAATGVAVVSTATDWLPGAYVEVVAAVPGSWFRVREVAIRHGTNSYGEVTLAMGAAGSEAGYELAAFPALTASGTTWQVYRLARPIKVPGGTRLAAKYATNGTVARTAYVALRGTADTDSEAPS